MADPTATPQPTNPATQPAPQATPTPAPQPTQTAQPAAQPGQDTNAPEPGGATAPASTLRPSTASGVHGVLANVALGALAGAVTGIKKAGNVAKNVAQHAPLVHAVKQEDALNATMLQQRQQEMQQKATEAMDEHQVKQLAIQQTSLDNLHKIAENRQIESLYPLQTEEAKGVLLTQHRAQDEADRTFLTHLQEAGINIEHKPFSQFSPGDGQAVGNGQKTVVNNGLTGQEAGGGFISNDELENTILPHDMSVVTDWTMDDKGTMTPTYRTLKAGENTAMDALVAHDAGMDRFNQLQDMYQKQVKNTQTQAVIGQDVAAAEKDKAEAVAQRAAATLNEAYAKQMSGGSGSTTPTAEVSQALAQLPPAVQQDLKQYDPGIQGLLIRGAAGWIDPNTFPQRLTKGGLGILRSTAASLMTEINPKWSDALYPSIKQAQIDLTSGKGGQAIRSFNQFLVHSATTKKISDDFQRTNSPLLNKPLNVLRSQYLGSPEVPEILAAIEAQRQEWQTFIDSGYKPDEQQSERGAVLMNDSSSLGQIAGVSGVMGDQAVGRLDQINEGWRTLTSQDWPNLVTPSGKQAAAQLGLSDLVAKYGSGGSLNTGRNAPQNGPTIGEVRTINGQPAHWDGQGWLAGAK